MFKEGPDFHFEISGYVFKITEVEITRVNESQLYF